MKTRCQTRNVAALSFVNKFIGLNDQVLQRNCGASYLLIRDGKNPALCLVEFFTCFSGLIESIIKDFTCNCYNIT